MRRLPNVHVEPVTPGTMREVTAGGRFMAILGSQFGGACPTLGSAREAKFLTTGRDHRLGMLPKQTTRFPWSCMTKSSQY